MRLWWKGTDRILTVRDESTNEADRVVEFIGCDQRFYLLVILYPHMDSNQSVARSDAVIVFQRALLPQISMGMPTAATSVRESEANRN